ncbi:MAG: SusC/RagA family TonB-linked outer membrane protein, partial [Bacteroidales bacterium]|nr:SusC/RagA family TonB-linked outer membrane protein [Bacteroidales bacterium]
MTTRKSKKLLSMFVAGFLLCYPGSSVWANGDSPGESVAVQQTGKTVTGTVVDIQGEPLIGVSVSVEGTNKGVVTDVNGKYSIQTQGDNQVLLFSYIGYKSVTVKADKNLINVTMEEDALALGEVVVTALGIKKEKKALGYSVQDINSDELLKVKTANPLNSLAGKIAGVNITQSSGSAGSGAQIILRGGTSLERDNQPVFVVDGVIFDNSTSVVGNSGFDGLTGVATTASNRVMDINPEDIENMSVLKGPAAAALYGSRAAAGVIIITTKKGKEGSVSVDVSSKLTTSWVNRLPEQQGKYKRGKYELSGNRTDRTMDSWGEPFASEETRYNNIEDFFQNGNVWDNNVSVSGGNKNGSFFLSVSRFDQEGVVPTTGYDKTTFRFNGDQKYGKLTVGANVAYSLANTDKTLTSQGLYNSNGNGAMGSTYIWPRSEDMQKYLNEDGTKYRNQDYNSNMADDTENPYWILNKNKLTDNTERFTGSVNFDYKITDWWNVSYRLGTDSYTTGNRTLIHSGGAIKALYQNGLLSENELKYRYISSNVMTSLNKTFGDFDLGLLLGTSTEDTKRETNRRMGYGFPNDFYSFSVVVDANKQFVQAHSQKRMVSAYGEFRVSYKNFAYFTVTERNDNTSTLPKENRSYWYPSFSGSLLFSELLPKNDILSFGKIRASYASVGKDADPYVTNTRLQAYQEFTDGKIGVYNITDPRGNPNLKPEITKSTELGLEMRFLNGRIGFDYTYYTNNSYNQLLYPRLSQSPGYYMICVNGGDLHNKGMELSISGQPVKTKDFTWESTLNLAGNRGTVANLFAGADILYVTDVQVGNAKAASFNNGVFMGISGSKWDRTPDGRVILDATGMPISDGKTTYNIGNREPKLTGGFNNSLQYKDWNLSFLLDFRVGGHVYNGTDYGMTLAGLSKRTEGRENLTVTGAVKTGGTTEAPIYEDRTFTFDAS